MKQIPTAESILKKHLIAKIQSGNYSTEDKAEAINDAMIEFAKLHCNKQGIAIHKTTYGSMFDSKEKHLQAVSDSYPLENIK